MSDNQTISAPTEELPLEAQPEPVTEVRGPALRRGLRLVTAAWLFGSVWMYATAGTPFTLFATQLGASEFHFGLLTSMPYLAALLTLPASFLIEATGARRKVFLSGLYPQRLVWFAIALLPIWMLTAYGAAARPHAMNLFLLLMFFMYASGAVGGCSWQSWMADLVPERRRGKYFARRRQIGIIASILPVWLLSWYLDHYAVGGSIQVLWCCALIFIVAAFFGLADITIFAFVPDIPKKPRRGSGLLKAMRKPLHDRRFLWFVGFVATITFAVSFMGQFATKYILEEVGVGNKSINQLAQMMLIIVPIVAQLLFFGFFGRATDLMGKKPMLAIAGLGLTPVAIGWVFITPQTIWLGFVLASAGAVLWCGVEMAQLNLVLETSGSGDQKDGNGGSSAYVAVFSIVISIAGFIGGIASGGIAQFMQNRHMQWDVGFKTLKYYDVLFLLSAGLRFLAVVIFVPHIKEQGARRTREAFRFMASNIYNNLFSMVQQPLRLFGLRRNGEEQWPVVGGECSDPSDR